jgi:hypothetical protein
MAGPLQNWIDAYRAGFAEIPNAVAGFCNHCKEYMPDKCPWCGFRPCLPAKFVQLTLFDTSFSTPLS